MRNVKSLFHVNFPTNNWDAMVNFYVNICGFDQAFVITKADMCRMFGSPVKPEDEKIPQLTYIRISPNSYIELMNNDPKEKKTEQKKYSSFHHIALLTDDIARTKKRFEDMNYPFYNNPIEKKPVTEFHMGEDGCLIAWSEDPDGHYIEIMQQSGHSMQEEFEKTHPITD